MHHSKANNGNLIANTVPQALVKPQNIISPNPTRDSRAFRANFESNSSYDTKWTVSWQTKNFGIPQHSNNEAYHLQRPYEIPVSPHAYVGQHPPNPTPFDFIQSVIIFS